MKVFVIIPFYLSFILLCSCKKDKIEFNESKVESIEIFDSNGGRVDWNVATNKIVYDFETDLRWDIYTCNEDKSNKVNLTSDLTGLTFGDQTVMAWQFRGQPAFDETGQYILFQVQNEHASENLEAEEHLSLGVNNDLWFMTADGAIKQKITNNPAGYSVLHPKFSHDGSKILWAEKYEDNETASIFGSWRMKIADVIISNDSLFVQSITDLEPCGEKWYETHAFSEGDNEIYFSSNYQTDLKASDLFKYNLNTQELTNLTNLPSEWEEMYNKNPANPSEYSFISSRFFNWNNSWGWGTLRTELYLNSGGTVSQLTYYNQLKENNSKKLTKEHYFIGDHCWSPDGKHILAILARVEVGSTTTDLLKINLK